MRVEAKKGCGVALILTAMILLHTNMYRAASLRKGNASSGCHGGLHECLVADEVGWEEFLMDSEISRVLREEAKSISSRTLISWVAAVPCGQGGAYINCLPPKN